MTLKGLPAPGMAATPHRNGHNNDRDNEHQPLLQQEPLLESQNATSSSFHQPTTPLPWNKLSILIAMRLAKPISFTIIFPFVNAMVYEVGATHDKAKVGYYAGIIESLFALSQCCTILFWGQLSDHIGRKPVLLSSHFGVACSATFFGLSRTFVGAVLARALAGATNGNVAVVKSVIGKITDHTNEACAFSFLPLTWSIGCFIGLLIGGYLSKPAQQYPSVFGSGVPLDFGRFWEVYRYFLPCFISAILTLWSMLLGACVLQRRG